MAREKMAGEEKTGVAALERAFAIIECFTMHDRGLTLAQIAQRTSLYKSTILRLCATLEKFGYLRRLGDGRFVLGSSAFRLGQIYQRSFSIADFVEPALRALARETEFSASFWIREEDARVCLFRTEFTSGRRDMSGVAGERCALDKGGSASTIFQAFSGAKGQRFDKARKSGVVVSLGEFIPELAAISSPVFETGGALAGALSLGGFCSQFDKGTIDRLTPRVVTAAQDLSAALGGRP
jgi:DNA-binding IclR family transcriptional regulator